MTINTYVAKPVEVKGIVWTGDNIAEIKAFCNGMARLSTNASGESILLIETLEGTMRASLDDTIVMGTRGEFYPVKPDVMRAKYDVKKESNV